MTYFLYLFINLAAVLKKNREYNSSDTPSNDDIFHLQSCKCICNYELRSELNVPKFDVFCY